MADENRKTIDVDELSPEERKAAQEVAEEKLAASAEGAKHPEEGEDDQDAAKEKVEKLEADPPEKLEDWPSDEAKYKTFGGEEHASSYDEAATSKLGPSNLRHNEDGSVEIDGEKVDNPEDYKGDPVPGGPTDPNAKDKDPMDAVKSREDKKKELEDRGKANPDA
jgi:hypothetical protein